MHVNSKQKATAKVLSGYSMATVELPGISAR